jgi:hypothetical protein
MSTSTTTGGAVRRATIPTPRPAEDDTVVLEPVEEAVQPQPVPTLPEPRHPWPEPWGSYRGARPRSEYWDVETATWRSRGPYPR